MKNNIFISTKDTDLICSKRRLVSFFNFILKLRNHEGWEVSILFCSDELMQQYNNAYRHIDSSTDILSFESGESYIDKKGVTWYMAGDIVISLDAMKRNCADFNVTLNEELKRLLIHGMLHLEGMDHGEAHISADSCIKEDESDIEIENKMLDIQEALLKDVSKYILIKEKK